MDQIAYFTDKILKNYLLVILLIKCAKFINPKNKIRDFIPIQALTINLVCNSIKFLYFIKIIT